MLSKPATTTEPIRSPLILLVEDERASRHAMYALLRGAGYETRAFASAEDALERLQSDRENLPSVALVDLNLPGMDGLELISRLRERDAGLFVVLITANDSPSLRGQIQQKHLGYLRKPINFEHLLHLIQERFPN